MPKIPATRIKKFYYRRAAWGNVRKHATLEKLLRDAHQAQDTVGKRTFKLGSGGEIKCANYSDKDDGILLFQIAAYVPGQPTSTVAKSARAKASKIDAEAAPDGKDYLDGDVFILVKSNNVIVCPSGVRESVADTYFRKILNKSGVGTETFSLEKIAKASKAKMIHDEGVKEIRLGASLYEASVDDFDADKPSVLSIRRYLAEQLERVFADDPELSEIKEKENLNIQITVRFDGKEARKHQKEKGFGSLGKERLMKASEKLLSESEDDEGGFVIITGANNEISSGDIRVSDTFRVSTLGKSLSRADAWDKLEQYAVQLEQIGVFAK